MIVMTLTGNLVRPAEQRKTQAGDDVCSFTVAVNIGSGDRKRTEYVDCALWGNRGVSLCQYLTKGLTVSVSGMPTVRSYEKDNSPRAQLQCRVQEISLHGGGKREEAPQGGQTQWDAPNHDDDSEIPF